MIAAHTLVSQGANHDDIDILTKDRTPSTIGGAQYLHQPIFEGQEPQGILQVVQLGGGEGYAYKVYGDSSESTSWSDNHQVVTAWGLRTTYKRLYEEWIDRIIVSPSIDWHFLDGIRSDYKDVISTIPASAWCGDESHSFPTTEAVLVPMVPPLYLKDTIVYSGRLEDQWHRCSNIFGHSWAEFSPERASAAYNEELPKEHLMSNKPMGTDCNCHARLQVLRAGRFGTWDRKILLHDVPEQVINALRTGALHAL